MGSTNVEVEGPNGEYIVVGGPAKAGSLTDLGSKLRIVKYAADQKGVMAQAYFESSTPESVLAVARRRLGSENVFVFNM